MQVLWWLVPPLVATVLAMLWAGFAGRERDEVRPDESDDALTRMATALSQPPPAPRRPPRRARRLPVRVPEPSHGVAVRRVTRPVSGDAARR
jgi:hypothetical protein